MSTLEQVQAMRLHSHTGEIDQIENDGVGDPLFVASAPLGAADDRAVWYITKITYEVIGSEKCPILTERSGTRQKWDDRADVAIMGWRP